MVFPKNYFSGGVCEKDWVMYDQYCVQVTTDFFNVTSILATENLCNQGSHHTDTLIGYWLEDLGLSQASDVFGTANDSKCFDSKGVEFTCEERKRIICKKPCKL